MSAEWRWLYKQKASILTPLPLEEYILPCSYLRCHSMGLDGILEQIYHNTNLLYRDSVIIYDCIARYYSIYKLCLSLDSSYHESSTAIKHSLDTIRLGCVTKTYSIYQRASDQSRSVDRVDIFEDSRTRRWIARTRNVPNPANGTVVRSSGHHSFYTTKSS